MNGLPIKSIDEQIRELDEIVARQEEWRKAQGIPKGGYKPEKEEKDTNGDRD